MCFCLKSPNSAAAHSGWKPSSDSGFKARLCLHKISPSSSRPGPSGPSGHTGFLLSTANHSCLSPQSSHSTSAVFSVSCCNQPINTVKPSLAGHSSPANCWLSLPHFPTKGSIANIAYSSRALLDVLSVCHFSVVLPQAPH